MAWRPALVVELRWYMPRVGLPHFHSHLFEVRLRHGDSDRTKTMKLSGTLHLSTAEVKRTCGLFNQFVTANEETFRKYFGADLHPGSLNILVSEPQTLQQDLDNCKPPPSIVIPKSDLNGDPRHMPAYIGDGRAWACKLFATKFEAPVKCWVFRRKGSRVAPGIIEIVAPLIPYSLEHGDLVTIEFT